MVLGDVSDELCATLGRYGAAKVYRVPGPEGLAQTVVDAMAQLGAEHGFGYALFGGGLLGFEIGAGLAARPGRGRGDGGHRDAARGDGKLVAERPILGDSAVSEITYGSDVGIVIGAPECVRGCHPRGR